MKQRIAAWGWLLVLGTVLVGGSLRIAKGNWIETQFWSLLPQSKQDPILKSAMDRLFVSRQKKVFWAIGHKNKEIAFQGYQQAQVKVINSSFLELKAFPNVEEVQKAFEDIYFPLRYQLLSSEDIKILNTKDPAVGFVMRLKSFLLSPMSGWGSGIVLKDPMLLFLQQMNGLEISAQKNHSDVPIARFWEKDGLRIESDHKTYYVLAAEMDGDPFSPVVQERLAILDQELNHEIFSQLSGLEVIPGGLWRFARMERLKMKRELNLLSFLSIAAVLLLFWVTFRSFWPLGMTLVSLLVGLSVGFVVCLWVFGRIHIVSMLFGTSLIGVGIDYSFHYFVQDSPKPLSKIAVGLVLGALTSILGFLALAFVPLPVLHQMALFSSVGLTATLLTVFCWFPIFKYSGGAQRLRSFLIIVFEKIGACREKMILFPQIFRLGILGIVILAAIGLFQLKIDDHPSQFQKPDATLLKAETKLHHFLNFSGLKQMAVIWGENPEALFESQESLESFLQGLKNTGKLKSFQGLSHFLPSKKRQNQEGTLLREMFLPHVGKFTSALSELGFNSTVGQTLVEDLKKPIGLSFSWKNFLNRSSMNFLSDLWLGPIEEGWASIFLLQGLDKSINLENQSGVMYIDPLETYSVILKLSRQSSLKWGLAAYFLVFCILILRYGRVTGFLLLLPCFISSVLTLAVLGWFGISFHLIHSLGLLIVLSLGVDYAIFFGEAHVRGDSADLPSAAITLSAFTTALSFGLFLFCSSPLLQALGLTVSLGIVFIYFGSLTAYGFLMRRNLIHA